MPGTTEEEHMGSRTKVLEFPRTHGRWELAGDATMRFARGRSAIAARVERGTVLVTQEGDVEDHVLEAGDEIVLRRGGLAVAWALTDAAISVRALPPTARRVVDDPAGAAA
jgi:Protein of unknown function (DUF2917)